MSFVSVLPEELQQEIIHFLETPKRVEEYPFEKKNFKEIHRIYFRVVLDELLLMTNNIKVGLEGEPQMPSLSGIHASSDIYKLDTGGQLTAQDYYLIGLHYL